MKVFISWSGEESHAVAQVLRVQLPCLINALKPFVSSEDIDKGAAWFQSIGVELEKSDFGILCLTNSNQNSKWVQFEAGALAGKFSKARVAPLLINTTPSSIKPPLSQFQLTNLNEREDFFKLLSTINSYLGENALASETLKASFENWWSPFTQKVKTALAQVPQSGPKEVERSATEILNEVLSLTRSIAANMPVGYDASLSDLFARQADVFQVTPRAPGLIPVMKGISGVAAAPGYLPVPHTKTTLNHSANNPSGLHKTPNQEEPK